MDVSFVMPLQSEILISRTDIAMVTSIEAAPQDLDQYFAAFMQPPSQPAGAQTEGDWTIKSQKAKVNGSNGVKAASQAEPVM